MHVGQVGGHLPADSSDLADTYHLQPLVAFFGLADMHADQSLIDALNDLWEIRSLGPENLWASPEEEAYDAHV